MEHKKIKMSALALSVLLALTACSDGDDGAQGPAGVAGQNGTDGNNGADGVDGVSGSAGKLTRIATVPTGAEVTGIFLSEEGDLFFNAQHPADSNAMPDAAGKMFNTGTVGVLAGVNFNNLPETLVESPVPASEEERQVVMSAYGQYQVLGQTGDTYAGMLPKGLGHIYSMVSDELILENDMPDFNGFIQTGAGKGYLFTNWEMFPGGMSRMAIEKDNQGSWSVTDAMMIDFDGVHGTAANCFGSVTPWNTPLTSEEWIVNSKVDTTTHPDWNNPAVMNTSIIGYMWQLTAPDAPNPYRYGYIAEVQKPNRCFADCCKALCPWSLRARKCHCDA